MANSNGLVASSLRLGSNFDWEFLIELLVCGVLSLFFLFYFNRVFGTLVSYALRAYTWHKYRVYIDIQALQISLLAGRIFFKGIRYYGNNEAIFVQGGYITWRYWLRRARSADIFHDKNGIQAQQSPVTEKSEPQSSDSQNGADASSEKGDPKGPNPLPCRIVVWMQGCEWFIYNRSPAYDAMIASMDESIGGGNPSGEHLPDAAHSTSTSQPSLRASSSDASARKRQTSPPVNESRPSQENVSSIIQDVSAAVRSSAECTDQRQASNSSPSPVFLRLLPVQFTCDRGAIVMGNENTTSILTAKFDRVDGEIDASQSRPIDQFKQLINLQFQHPVVQMKPNMDYKEPQLTAASRMKETSSGLAASGPGKSRSWNFRKQRHRLWHGLRDLVPFFQSSVESFPSSVRDRKDPFYASIAPSTFIGEDRWLGLTRYLDDEEREEQDKWGAVEYAKSSTIVDSPGISLNVRWDVAGTLPDSPGLGAQPGRKGPEDINGDEPPEWAMDLTIQGGVVRYGPWADRQRANLQSFFFPFSYRDSPPAQPLKPGQTRMSTVFRLFVDIEDDTILRVPTREGSKDWAWKGRDHNVAGGRVRRRGKSGAEAHAGDTKKGRKRSGKDSKDDKAVSGPDIRPFGWLDLKISNNSSVSYVMDMVPGRHGFQNTLRFDIRSTELFTSINHDLLWRSGPLAVNCDLSNPLKWNALHTWKFDISSANLELFLLRDHIFLITDLVNDWSAGPPQDYYTFTPFQYNLMLAFPDFKLYLNANDSNIINNPSDLEDNTFIILSGRSLNATLGIPKMHFESDINTIHFDVEADHVGLRLRTPPWNTYNTFLDASEVATLRHIDVIGDYTYYISTSRDLTDTVLLDVRGQEFSIDLYGFLVRYLMKVKDNYFGDDIHFKTLEEYQQLVAGDKSFSEGAEAYQYHQSKTNDLDVILSIAAESSRVYIPANLYSARENITVEVEFVGADLRFTNYYMDLVADFSPLAVSMGQKNLSESIDVESSGTQIFLDGFNITGHRLFGLPPTEPTYVCNWDIAVGALTGECSPRFLKRLASSLESFAFSFHDDENALPANHLSVLHDVTFLRARMQPIKIWFLADDTAFLISTDTISLDFNDWAGYLFSERLQLLIPSFTMACVDIGSASRHRAKDNLPGLTHAFFQTSLTLAMANRNLEFSTTKKKQQRHIEYHDQRTGRAAFLLSPFNLNGKASKKTAKQGSINPPAIPVPLMPDPVLGRAETISDLSSQHSQFINSSHAGLQRKASSFSLRSSISSRRTMSIRREPAFSPSFGKVGQNKLTSRHENLHTWDRSRSRTPSAHHGRTESQYIGSDNTRKERNASPRGFAFSSSFAGPHFPLMSINLDFTEVPEIPSGYANEQDYKNEISAAEEVPQRAFDEDITHTSVMLNLNSGIRAYCNPKALHSLSTLLDALQPKDALGILDSFQIDVLRDLVINTLRKTMGSGKVHDFSLRIPYTHIRLVNPIDNTLEGVNASEQDQYNVVLAKVASSARIRTMYQEKEKSEEGIRSYAVHLSVDSIGLSAKERVSAHIEDHATIRMRLHDLSLWVAYEQNLSANIQFRELEMSSMGTHIESLASLIHRTTMLMEDLTDTFVLLDVSRKQRIRYFMFLLTMSGAHIPDPPFLIRPSYILRAAPDHLRLRDSWKIISRFRYIYRSLPDSEKEALRHKCDGDYPVCPDDAGARVISSLDKWRSWDLAQIQNCAAMKKLYGSAVSPESLEETGVVAGKVTINTAAVRLIIDPGPNQSEIVLDTLSIALSRNILPGANSPLELSYTGSERIITQVHSSDVAIRLNWELCELVEDILKLQKTNNGRVPPPVMDVASAKISRPKRVEIHTIFSTDSGVVALNTINLKLVSASKGLKGSVMGTAEKNEGGDFPFSILVHADAGSSEILSHSRQLSQSRLRQPSIFISRNQRNHGGVSASTWQIAGACETLTYNIKEEILGLLDIVDMVITDEVAYLHRLISGLQKISGPPEDASKTTPVAEVSTPRVNLALFLSNYHISIALLPYLSYLTTGTVIRTSMSPSVRSDFSWTFDFDVKEQFHAIQTIVNQNAESVSHLIIPPINGRLSTYLGTERTVLETSITVEAIDLEAAAIQGFLSTLNRPEIENLMKDLESDVLVVRNHVEEIFGTSKGSKEVQPPDATKPFVYDAHITIAGINVYASTPGDSPGSNQARLNLNLGSIQMKAKNLNPKDDLILVLPEILVKLAHVEFNMARMDEDRMQPCGNVSFGATLTCTSKLKNTREQVRSYHLDSDGLDVNLYAETASTIVDVITHLQNRIKKLEFSREVQYLRRLGQRKAIESQPKSQLAPQDTISSTILASLFAFELLNIHVCWIVGSPVGGTERRETEDLVLSLQKIYLTKREENEAKLVLSDLQLQMVPNSWPKRQRSMNSALLPEVVFNVAYVSGKEGQRFAFQAAGKSLDVRLTSSFILPADDLRQSLAKASQLLRNASGNWKAPPISGSEGSQGLFSKKKLASLLIDADFAGAVVYMQGRKTQADRSHAGFSHLLHHGQYGRFGQNESSPNVTLRAPGAAIKIEYKSLGPIDPSLNAEIQINASNNTIYPTIVPLILEISSSIKEVVGDSNGDDQKSVSGVSQSKSLDEETLLAVDPNSVLGKCRVNIGFRICRQEFSLSCQPIARVAATAQFDDVYMTVNTIQTAEHGRFLALATTFTNFQATVQHVYSRESTASLEVRSLVLSFMNSKHLSGKSGISAVLKVSPIIAHINMKQLQDFLLFREIWTPPEVRHASKAQLPVPSQEPQAYLVQRYKQVAAASAFPWNATAAIAKLDIRLDFGQALGKSTFIVSDLWASSSKTTNWEQNMCLGFASVKIDSVGRLSGFVELQTFKVRTSIQWPVRNESINQTPLVSASLGFGRLRVKAAFDYQVFLIADITAFEFLMHNVRDPGQSNSDRLVGILDGDGVQVFCTATSAAQGLALYQTIVRFIQEKKSAYEASLRDIERFLMRKSSQSQPPPQSLGHTAKTHDRPITSPISLQTDVMVTLRSVHAGAFPSTFFDSQIFKLEALDMQARFAVRMENGKIHSGLGLNLGQLSVALSAVRRPNVPKVLGEVDDTELIECANDSRGGTILRVPQTVATMQTWQVPDSNHIDYIFRSSLKGKVDVGWNYSRISFIRGMWANHSRSLALKLGKPLAQSTFQITGGPEPDDTGKDTASKRADSEQNKITAVVNVPQSKYEYTALEPPIIDTPQLRDMGEATPPLEWIGLHRDRLPNVTHQILIVSLLEIAREVEDAYTKILGSS
ncbi:fermentation associated protein [Xylona heveae TC161]|uniref:Fermentation associated protein n=1 Tax=Xylona heveae (strain CBS 132557 / TC161) TaxID=1328760 RepID=A0A165HFX6_XYLHT|nr:fermentation associated protein [Xylona heveae TC161]KZF23452.1 fermentation associated protein [Xylona heveae TC161]